MATPGQRIRLSAGPADRFIPRPDRIARISLAGWDASEPEGRRDPVLVDVGAGVVRALVVVWPTSAAGLLDVAAVRAGDVAVVPWDLTRSAVEALREIGRDWPLDRHDLLVTGSADRPQIDPVRTTLRTASLGFDLERRITLAASLAA